MRWHPFFNAAGAAAYIGAVVLFLNFLQSQNKPDNLIDGMGAISLLVFSVAVMGFLFCYRPAVLLLEGERAAAVAFFAKTLVIFGIITATLLVLVSTQ